jgi:TPR repeat protein
MDAHYNLSIMYSEGQGNEKDLKKKVYHLEEAAIGGHADAR